MIPDETEETSQRDRTVVISVGNAGTVAILLEAISLHAEQAAQELEQVHKTLQHLKQQEQVQTLSPLLKPITFIPEGKPRGKGKTKKDWSK
jgi:hypothetical protein